jgi:hypothetical protein
MFTKGSIVVDQNILAMTLFPIKKIDHVKEKSKVQNDLAEGTINLSFIYLILELE